jgi:hypothetical protein
MIQKHKIDRVAVNITRASGIKHAIFPNFMMILKANNTLKVLFILFS